MSDEIIVFVTYAHTHIQLNSSYNPLLYTYIYAHFMLKCIDCIMLT